MAKKKGRHSAAQQADKQAGGGLAQKVREFATFFEESKVEIKKVVWPSRKETVTTCIAVLVVTLVISLYLGIVDFGLTKLVEAILS
ncbi:preprotein translocase subunit SecE [Salidesulfovibrio brasiliensis]|uniref:preprotein translocase subunit SecE n=1 Tax=Salidesulfovibrio brasiliensis TaxID=221711 RepID=UPI0006D26D95|nr:preprotein translocase subunit SecE [Salidesulfovibrio brasiliensis]